MLRLRPSFILARLLSTPSAAPVSHLHRLLSTAPAAVSPIHGFNAEEYLVSTCGLTGAQALRASTKISHVKSPANPDVVLAFLAGLGLSSTDVAAVVAKDPKILCSAVEKTLSPVVTCLAGLGLTADEIALLVSLAPRIFRCRSVVAKMRYYLPIFGSFGSFFRGSKHGFNFLSSDLEKVVKPNVAFLQECGGVDARDLPSTRLAMPWMLGMKPKRVRALAVRAEALGVPRGSGMFRQALRAVSRLNDHKIADKVGYLKKTFRWSDDEVGVAVCQTPLLLLRSKDTLQTKSEFLLSEVGLEPAYLAHRPVMLGLSLGGRLRPRHYAVKFLKENGLLGRHMSYFSSLVRTEKVFLDKYVHPYKEAAPHLAQDYAAACRGEVPTRFRFT